MCFSSVGVPSGYTQLGQDGLDCPGEDIEYNADSVQECADKCDKNIFCGGILVTYAPVHGYTCWLKYKLCDNPVPLEGGRLFQKENPCKITYFINGLQIYSKNATFPNIKCNQFIFHITYLYA